MFGQNLWKDRAKPSDGESSAPLLGSSRQDSVDENVIFAVGDVEDEPTNVHSGRESPYTERPEQSVRFQEEVQVIGLPLRSTIQSREAGDDHPRTARIEV
jgi:sodium-coupled neutral amino acid transporter 11